MKMCFNSKVYIAIACWHYFSIYFPLLYLIFYLGAVNNCSIFQICMRTFQAMGQQQVTAA
jgi:hypothetical protein